MNSRRLLTRLTLIALLLLNSGCFYLQAARGQMEVLAKREPLDELLASEALSPELAAKLRLVSEARDFSIQHLKLPDNDSYRSYTDLRRDYVLWNIFAAREFSLQPETWCYPIVGCLGYRGYFKQEAANKVASNLRAKGLDVAVGGVPAYSTLGRFDDPVLNTMMHWDDSRLVAVLFHELAHQVIYIKDDTAFNESFATAVEEIGLELWLASRGQDDDLAIYQQRKQADARIFNLAAAAREDLALIFGSANSDQVKREQKAARYARLSNDVAQLLADEGLDSRHWLVGELNNARLIPMALYETWVPSFKAVYSECQGDFTCFYAQVKELGELGVVDRETMLKSLAAN